VEERKQVTWEEFMDALQPLAPTLQSKWSKSAEDDVTSISARRELLVAALERCYGIQRIHAELQVDRWVSDFEPVEQIEAGQEGKS
jgi:hypothetical protein